MKKLIITIISLLAAAAAVFFGALVLTGRISLDSAQEVQVDSTAVAYISYMDMYLEINGDGIIIRSSLAEPEDDIPEITGLTLGSVIVGEEVEATNASAFEYALAVVLEMKSCYILEVDEVFVSSDEEITVYAREIKILLGEDENTSEKINDLKDFYYTVVEMEGTLDMQEVSESNIGYTFKVSSG